MKITRYEHACFLVEEGELRLLTDIGSWNTTVPEIADLNAVLITHEHADHFEVDKLKELLKQNPNMVVITHPAVGELLNGTGIVFQTIEPGERVEIREVAIESVGTDHAIIYGDTPPCRNTGYLIADKLFMPGDALHDIPKTPVEVLALPTGGPWLKISEAIDYAKKVNPKVAFPIHDAMYTEGYRMTGIPRWIGANLEAAGITFENIQPNESLEY